MSASHTEIPDDSDFGADAAEQSETRMREALERLSSDRSGGDKSADRSSDKPNTERVFAERTMGDRNSHERPQSDRFGLPRSSPSQNGSFSSAGPRRHRYVQDGEVPVVQMSTVRDRRRETAAGPVAQEQPTDQARVLLAQERAARQRAEQALERAQSALHGLETRLGHAEITQREAVEQARAHEAETRRLQDHIAELSAELKASQAETVRALRERDDLQSELDELRAVIETEGETIPEPPPLLARAARAPEKRGPARKRAAPAAAPVVEHEEPEPVKWWLTPAPKPKAKIRRTA